MKPMTPNQVREFLPLFQAFADGKKIEVFVPDNDPAFPGRGTWVEEPLPDFNPASKWRVKFEPRVIYVAFEKLKPEAPMQVRFKPFAVPEGMAVVAFKEVVE